MSAAALVALLSQRLRLLASGPVVAPGRQRTRRAAHERDVGWVRQTRGEATFAAAWAAGRALPLDQAVAEALEVADGEERGRA